MWVPKVSWIIRSALGVWQVMGRSTKDIRLKEDSSNKYSPSTTAGFSRSTFLRIFNSSNNNNIIWFQNLEVETSLSKMVRSLWAIVPPLLKSITQACRTRQRTQILEDQAAPTLRWASRISCSSAWTPSTRWLLRSSRHMLTVSPRSRSVYRTRLLSRILVKALTAKDPKKKSNWFRLISSTPKDWRSKHRPTKRAGHSRGRSTRTIEPCNSN